jgi:hypothetical protein
MYIGELKGTLLADIEGGINIKKKRQQGEI